MTLTPQASLLKPQASNVSRSPVGALAPNQQHRLPVQVSEEPVTKDAYNISESVHGIRLGRG